MKPTPYLPKRKLMSLVSVPDYRIEKGVIIGVFDGRNRVTKDGASGDGEIYVVKNLTEGNDGETYEIWPEFIVAYRGKA